MVDADTQAFNDYVAAAGMPKDTAEQQKARREAMQEGLKTATTVPFNTMQLADRAWEPLETVARVGQYSSNSDVLVGAKALEAAVYGAYRNVLINLPSVEDSDFTQEVGRKAEELYARAQDKLREIETIINQRSGDA